MPFARIALLEGKSPAYRRTLADQVHKALVETFHVPLDDRFQAIDQYAPGELIFDRQYLGGPRSDDFVLIHITAGKPRDTATKKALYRRLVELLAQAPGLNDEDVMVVINTTQRDEWSFGGGRASMVIETEAVDA